jgi:rod shape-determining protein MreC
MRKSSKRARQIKALLFFGLLLTLVLIVIVSTIGRTEFNTAHKLALEALGAAQYGISRVTAPLAGIRDSYAELVGVREENVRLREELQKYKAATNDYREAVATNVRLANLLGMKEFLATPTLSAEIIGLDPSHWFKTVIIGRGSSDGVRTGMPVTVAEGIVGQVVNTSPHYAKVLLATDPNSAIDALVQRNRVQGIVKGDGAGYRMEYVLKNSEVQKGDRVVTSGIGEIFPKGIPIGTVSRVEKNRHGMFQKIELEPATDFSQLEYLLIVMKKDPLAR